MPSDLKRVWSVCFVWPDGAHWSSTPSVYFSHLLEFIRVRADDDIIVFVHADVLPHVRPFLSADNVHIRSVPKKYDAFMPTSMRFAPFFKSDDLTRDSLIIVADIHDDFRIQNRLVNCVLDDMHKKSKSVGLTMWPATGNGIPYCCDILRTLNIAPGFCVVSNAPSDYHWHTDGGLLISTPKSRDFFAHATDVDYTTHLDRFWHTYGHLRSADEQVLETYIHMHPRLCSYVCAQACAFPHRSRIRASKSRAVELNLTMPAKKPAAHGILLEGEHTADNPHIERPKPIAFHALHFKLFLEQNSAPQVSTKEDPTKEDPMTEMRRDLGGAQKTKMRRSKRIQAIQNKIKHNYAHRILF